MDETINGTAGIDPILDQLQEDKPQGTAANDQTPQGFSHALHWIEQGMRVARIGWNGKNQWVGYVSDITLSNQDGSEQVRLRSFLALMTVQGHLAPWLPSQSDLLDKDWVIVGVPAAPPAEPSQETSDVVPSS